MCACICHSELLLVTSLLVFHQGMLSVGLFKRDDPVSNLNLGTVGLFQGGGGKVLGLQLLGCVCIVGWSSLVTIVSCLVSR